MNPDTRPSARLIPITPALERKIKALGHPEGIDPVAWLVARVRRSEALAGYLRERVWPSDEDGATRDALWRALTDDDRASVNAADLAAREAE